MSSDFNFIVFDSAEQVALEAAQYIAQRINYFVEQNTICHVVLPGGTTPQRCLEHLSAIDLPWGNIHWYPGDERCYPQGHADRNDTMILNTLFTDASHVVENFHPMPAELGAERGAERYCEQLDSIGLFDLVVLGMGEDGHTASLFPGNDALKKQASAVPVFNSPKPPSDRVSISLKMLKQASERVVIATGENKREAFNRLSNGEQLPVVMIKPDRWFVDEQAVANISVT
jgi:6-phosphogluconolactonase